MAVAAAGTENRSGVPNVQASMHIRLASLVTAAAAVALLGAPSIASAAGADPLGCSAAVFDPADEVDDAALTPLISATGRELNADVHVRVERVVDGDLEDRIDQLIAQCPGWETAVGELADDLIVVMFSPTERESALYYGADHADRLEDGWETVVDAMTTDLRAGDYDGAVEAAMRRLDSVSAGSSTSSFSSSDSGSGSDFPAAWLLLIVLLGVAGAIYQWYRGDTGGGGSGWDNGSSWRRSSFSSWGSSRSSSGGGGGGSSSRSSGRAGGGSKKW